jgi:hypothetical protein
MEGRAGSRASGTSRASGASSTAASTVGVSERASRATRAGGRASIGVGTSLASLTSAVAQVLTGVALGRADRGARFTTIASSARRARPTSRGVVVGRALRAARRARAARVAGWAGLAFGIGPTGAVLACSAIDTLTIGIKLLPRVAVAAVVVTSVKVRITGFKFVASDMGCGS